MITWFVATAGLMMSKHVRGKEFVTTLMIAGAAAIVFLIPKIDALLTTWETTGVMNRNVEERMEWFTNPALSDMSSWKRADVALEVWDKFTEHPFVGLGTGASWELEFPSHNQYLSFMLEHGVIGALIVPLLILSTTWGAQGHERPVAMLFAVTVMLISLTSHTMVYRVNSLALFALMAAIAAEHRLREVEGEPPVSEPAAPRPVPAEAW
jgi:O-antigen ligase